MRTFLRSNTRGIETTAGWVVGLLGIWCWLGEWFSTVYYVHVLQGSEGVIAVCSIGYSYINFRVAHSDRYFARSIFALTTATIIALSGALIAINPGWQAAGVPMAIIWVGALVLAYFQTAAKHESRKRSR